MFQCAVCAIENQLIIQRLSRQLVSENTERTFNCFEIAFGRN